MNNNKVFILHEDDDVFTSYGVLRVNVLYDAYINNNVSNDLTIAGFFDGEECQSKILNITPVIMKDAYVIDFGATSMLDNFVTVYSKQKFMNQNGVKLSVDEITNPDEILVCLNGMVFAKSVAKITETTQFYAVECDPDMPTLFGSKILLYPIEDGDKNNPFLKKSKKEQKK